MSEIILIHRPRNVHPDELNASGCDVAIWSTCLRQIAFLHSKDFSQFQNSLTEADEVYRQEAAFAFILEVVCGLKSPLVGETEVQGQFKQFVSEMPTKYPEFWGFFASFFQGILSESKHVRTEYLKNLGSQSYGSLIRRRLKASDSVSIIGAGQLTQQILPWLKEVGQIHVHARSLARAQGLKDGFANIQLKPWPEIPEHQVLVIAAPVSNQTLIEALRGRLSDVRPFLKLIDLRGESVVSESELNSLGLGSENYESLSALMSEINHDQQRISERVCLAQKSIRKCGEAFMNRAVSRPGGWEDLCG